MRALSERISSCTGLINQAASRTYSFIPFEHRRWIDRSDVVQEGYIAAIEAEKEYDPTFEMKYSTFVYNALTFHFNHEFTGRLYRQKRFNPSLVELDALTIDVEDSTSLSPSTEANTVDAFVKLCEILTPQSLVWFIGTIFSSSRPWKRVVPLSGAKSQNWMLEVKNAAEQQGLQWNDVSAMLQSDKAQKMALIRLAQNSSIGLGTEMEARVLECIGCGGRFALAAVRTGRYIADTLTCLSCYREMQQAKSSVSCFGKIKTIEHEGYSEHDIECSLHCKDRKVCRQFIEQGTRHMKDKKNKKPATNGEAEETTATATAVDEESAAPAPSKKKKAAAPPPKPAKAAKADAEEAPRKSKSAKEAKPSGKEGKKRVAAESNGDGGYPAPKDVVKWPHKTGSWMQYCFQQAHRGVKATELESETNESGRKWAIFLKVLRGGKSGMKRPTHTWKLDENGGKLRVYDVKYLGEKEA